MCSRFAPLFFLSVCHLTSYHVPRSLHDPIALVKYYDCIIRFRTPPVTSAARPLYFLGVRPFLSTSPPYFLSTGRLLWRKASIPFKRRPTPSRSNHTPLHNLFLCHTGTEGVCSHQSRGSSIRTVFGGVPPHHLAPCGIATGSIPHHVGIHGLSLS
jgi:hypothetical protein